MCFEWSSVGRSGAGCAERLCVMQCSYVARGGAGHSSGWLDEVVKRATPPVGTVHQAAPCTRLPRLSSLKGLRVHTPTPTRNAGALMPSPHTLTNIYIKQGFQVGLPLALS